MRVVAGCDGGGSKCTVRVAVLQDGLQVRQGQATTGPANVRSDPVVALENICQALRQATIAAELPEDHAVDHCVAALAGAALELVRSNRRGVRNWPSNPTSSAPPSSPMLWQFSLPWIYRSRSPPSPQSSARGPSLGEDIPMGGCYGLADWGPNPETKAVATGSREKRSRAAAKPAQAPWGCSWNRICLRRIRTCDPMNLLAWPLRFLSFAIGTR